MRIATKCKRALAGFFCNGLATKHYLVLFLLLTATNPVHAQTVTLFTDNFDGAATGWVVDPLGFDTATTGQWQIANPTNTNFQNGTTTSGVNALVTQANNTSDFDADIDNGSTSVQSPVIAIPAGATTATLTGQYYLADTVAGIDANSFSVIVIDTVTGVLDYRFIQSVQSDPGAPPAYQAFNVDLSDYAGRNIRIMFTADGSDGGLVEASVDDVVITADVFEGAVELNNNADSDSFFTDFEFKSEGASTVFFQATITNSSTTQVLALNSIVDSIHGDVSLLPGTCGALVGTSLPAGGSATCIYSSTVTLAAGTSEINELSVNATQAGLVRTVTDGTTVGVQNSSGGPAINNVFYIPYPEDQLLRSLQSIYNSTQCNGAPQPQGQVTTVVGLTVISNGTYVYYDHQEDGFEPDLTNPVQSTTEVWGDGDVSNGAPPGVLVDADDVLDAGTEVVLRNDVDPATRDTVIDFDGGDKIASNRTIALTRAGWADGPNTLLAGSFEMYSTREQWGDTYVFPIGEDSPSFAVYEYVGASVLSQANGTLVNVDINGDGDFLDPGDQQNVVVDEGQALLIDGGIQLGTVVTASDNVRVDIVTGDVCATYESRFITLFPRDSWSSNYYNPVDSTPDAQTTTGGDADAVVTLFNPHTSGPITVTMQSADGLGGVNSVTVLVPAGGAVDIAAPQDSGSRFFTDPANNGGSEPEFYAVVAVDQDNNPAGSTAHDWGITLIPEGFLSDQVFVGTGLGRDPDSTVNPTENGSPVWFTVAKRDDTLSANGIDVCIDYNADGGPNVDPISTRSYDVQRNLNVFENLLEFDPDGDQSGMLLFICDSDIADAVEGIITAAWGQDPASASGGAPAIDIGTGIPNVRSILVEKNGAFVGDLNGDNLANVNDVITYAIDVTNAGLIPAATVQIKLEDLLPTMYVEYVANSTIYNDGVNPPVTLADDPSGSSPFPLDTDGPGAFVPTPIGIGETGTFFYSARIINLPLPPEQICNQATGAVFSVVDFIQNCISVSPNQSVISGMVELDTDNNATGDTPLGGIFVQLYSDPLGTGNPADGAIQRTVQTAPDGSYSFVDLPAGNYTVVQIDPAGNNSVSDIDASADTDAVANVNTNDNTIPVTVAFQETDADNNFVDELSFAGVGDLVYYDLDGNGSFDGFDSGIAGVEVRLCPASNSLIAIDDFSAVSYSNNSTLWAGDWVEQNDNNSPNPANGGNVSNTEVIFINGSGQLVIDADGAGDPTITRELDLSNTLGDVTLSIAWEGFNSVYEANDEIDVAWSTSFAGPYTVLSTFEGQAIDNTSGTLNVTFDPPNNSTVFIRFAARQFNGGTEALLLNSVQVDGRMCQFTTTDVNGAYFFDSVSDDSYTVTVDPNGTTLPSNIITQTADPDASLDSESTTSVVGGIGSRDEDFGYSVIGITGTVSADTTRDGIGDTPLPGVLVDLFTDPNGDGDPADGVLIDTVTTNASGGYGFVVDSVGDYVVVERDPVGYDSVNDGDASADAGGDAVNDNALDNRIPVTVSTNELDADNNFVDRIPTGNANGVIWLDTDKDGVNDIGENGLSNVTVFLCDAGVSPCNSVNAIATAQTDANGSYGFANLPAGNYQVQVDPSEFGAGELNGLTETLGNLAGNTGAFSVVAGQTVFNAAGYVPDGSLTDSAVVGGNVWSDADADAVLDAGEAGLSGVDVFLCLASAPVCDAGSAVSTATTSSDGSYLFTAVAAGEYVTAVDLSDIDLSAFCNPTATAACSTTSSSSSPFTLVPEDVVSNLDFGFDTVNSYAISDGVYFDNDNDQTRDVGENGLADVSLDLLDCGTGTCNDGDEVVVATTVTNANGDFNFSGLPDGNYRVQISDNAGLLNELTETTATGGFADYAVNGSDIDNSGTNQTFGYNRPGSIAGSIFSDADSDAVLDVNESGLVVDSGGVPILVELQDGSCTPGVNCITTNVNADGSYLFSGLSAGNYTVEVANPPAGSSTTGGNTLPVSLGFGESMTDINFGYNNAALEEIQGVIFLDKDTDGTYEPNGTDLQVATTLDNEPGIEGVTVDLVTPAVTIINGAIDLNNDGVINTLDAGTYSGIAIIDGQFDLDGNGAIDTGDDGSLSGFAVLNGSLDSNADGSIGTMDDGVLAEVVVATTTTDANGDYAFNDVPDGDYLVKVTDVENRLDGLDITSGLDELPAQPGNPTSVDFGYIDNAQTAQINSGLWIDQDGDGVRDLSETPISGVTIFLCGAPLASAPCDPSDPEFIGEAVTDANGNVSFDSLPAGDYVLDVDSTDPEFPSDLNEVSYPGLNPNNPISLSEGETYDADFGYQPDSGEAAITGTLWIDENPSGVAEADGVFNAGELGLGGITVELLDNLSSGAVIATTTTNPDGSYSFTGLAPCPTQGVACYMIRYDQAQVDALGLNGAEPTNTPDQNNGDPVNPAPDGEPDRVYLVELSAGEVASDYNFGFTYPDAANPAGSVEGYVYFEPASVTPDGDFDVTTDTGVEQVTVNLVDGSGNIVATAVTGDGTFDANGDGSIDAADIGYYSFNGVLPGNYSVVVTDTNGTLAQLNPSGDPDELGGLCATCDQQGSVSVTAGNTAQADFGYIGEQILGNIGSSLWLDVTGDGIFQPEQGDAGIAGVTVQCWVDSNGNQVFDQDGTDNLVRTVTTDENGEYVCEGLPTGGYFVVVTDQAGVLSGFDPAATPASAGADTIPGTDDDLDGVNKLAVVVDTPWYVQNSGGGNLSADFAVTGSLEIAGNVFVEDEDLVEPDDNGTVETTELDATPGDGDDAPAQGVTIVLLRQLPDGSYVPLRSVLTDALGDYSFANLPPGEYRVVVDPSNSEIDGFGQTADPDLAGEPLPEDRVCDSPTNALCDDQTEISLSASSVSGINFGYQDNFATTPVTMNFFHAVRSGEAVEFNWQTSNEVGHAGFQIYERGPDGWNLLTDELIVGQGQAVMETQSYSFTAQTDAKWFALVDVSNQEEVTPHGPFRAGKIYGANMVTPDEYDWQGIGRLTDTDAARASTQNRIKSLINSGAYEDDFLDEADSEEDDLEEDYEQ